MLDRTEPPTIQDGYALSVAFVSLLDVVRCVQGILDDPASVAEKDSSQSSNDASKAAGEESGDGESQ